MSAADLRLGVNIDHVATIRNARGGGHPDVLRAAHLAARSGADGITAHLREDRRHIRDEDIARLRHEIDLPLNLEMAATAEMLEIALRHRPHAVCLVPERREERTTEGGLDVVGGFAHLQPFIARLNEAGCRVSLFVAPEPAQLDAARALGAPVVELHTGRYADALDPVGLEAERARLAHAAAHAADLGLEVHAGHGLRYDNVAAIAALPQVRELNIGHFLVGEAVFVGLAAAIAHMRELMRVARS